MRNSREQIYKAAWDLVTNNPIVQEKIVSTSRVLKPIANIKPEHCPALFMVQAGETAEYKRGLPTKWTLKVHFLFYVDAIGDTRIEVATLSNELMDMLENVFMPSGPQNVQTLSGLVDHCQIEGQIETDEGVLGPRSAWMVPVNILVP